MSDISTYSQKMPFSFEINLRRMALHATALCYWKNPEMEVKLKKFYYSYRNHYERPYLLIKYSIEKIDKSLYPSDMYSELVEAVISIGYQMHEWFNHLRMKNVFKDQCRRQTYDKFFKDIYWTHYGTIDVVKILKYSWLKIPNVDLEKMYIMACRYCSEELIEEIWGKISCNKRNHFNYKKFGLHVVAYWDKLRQNKPDEVLNKCIPVSDEPFAEIYDRNQSLKVNMLRWSVFKGVAPAVKYFWYKLSEDERNENIEWCLTNVSKNCDSRTFRGSQYAEIIFFFLNFLNEHLKIKLFNTVDMRNGKNYENGYFIKIIESCINAYPWYELLKPLFNEYEHILNEEVYNYLLRSLLSRSGESFFQHIFIQLWRKIPNEKKTSAAVCMYRYSSIGDWDISSAKVFLNDPLVSSERGKIIKSWISDYENVFEMIKNDKECKKLLQFINEILIPQNLEINIQEVLKSVYQSILEGEIETVNNLLSSFSLQEISDIKNHINPQIICYFFIIRNHYEWADKFLIWKFASENEVKNFKKVLYEKRWFIYWYIEDAWNVSKENIGSAKCKTDNILDWFLGDEKENELTLDILDDRYQDDSSEYFIKGYMDIEFWEDFMRWSLVHDEAIQKFKNDRLREKFEEAWLPTFVENGRFDDAIKLGDWLFDNRDEMYDRIKKSLSAGYSSSYCYKYISECCNPNRTEPLSQEEMIMKFKNFINFFKGRADILKILNKHMTSQGTYHKNQLEGWDSDTELTGSGYCAESEHWESLDFEENYCLFLSLLHAEYENLETDFKIEG